MTDSAGTPIPATGSVVALSIVTDPSVTPTFMVSTAIAPATDPVSVSYIAMRKRKKFLLREMQHAQRYSPVAAPLPTKSTVAAPTPVTGPVFVLTFLTDPTVTLTLLTGPAGAMTLTINPVVTPIPPSPILGAKMAAVVQHGRLLSTTQLFSHSSTSQREGKRNGGEKKKKN